MLNLWWCTYEQHRHPEDADHSINYLMQLLFILFSASFMKKKRIDNDLELVCKLFLWNDNDIYKAWTSNQNI